MQEEINSPNQDIILSDEQKNRLEQLLDCDIIHEYLSDFEYQKFISQYMNFLNSLELVHHPKGKENWIPGQLEKAFEFICPGTVKETFRKVLRKCSRKLAINELKNKKGENADDILKLIANRDPFIGVRKGALRAFAERDGDERSIDILMDIVKNGPYVPKPFLIDILKERFEREEEFKEQILEIFVEMAMWGDYLGADDTFSNIMNFIAENGGSNRFNAFLRILKRSSSAGACEAVVELLAETEWRINRVLESFLDDIKNGRLEKYGRMNRNLKKIFKGILRYRKNIEKEKERFDRFIYEKIYNPDMYFIFHKRSGWRGI